MWYLAMWNVKRATESLHEVVEFIRRLRIGGGPRPRFLLVRLCSAFGYGTLVGLKDIWPSYVSRKHEYLLYGMVFPGLDIRADKCKCYDEWVGDVLEQCTPGLHDIAFNRWRPWNDYWVDYWRKNKTCPIVEEDEGVEKDGHCGVA